MSFFLGCLATPDMHEEQWPFSSVEELFLWLWLLCVDTHIYEIQIDGVSSDC